MHAGRLPASGFHGFEYGVQVVLVAHLHELFAKLGDVDTLRHADVHLHGEHGRTGVGRRVAAGAEFGDVDAPAREEAGDIEHHALLVETDDVHGVGQAVPLFRPLPGLAQGGVDAVLFLELAEFGLQPVQRVPVAVDLQQHGEFLTVGDRAALDVRAAAVQYGRRQALKHAGSIVSYSENAAELGHFSRLGFASGA